MKNVIWQILFSLLVVVLLTLSIKACLKKEDPKIERVNIIVFNKEASPESNNHNFLNAVSTVGDTINFIDLSIEKYEKLKLDSTYKVEIKPSVQGHPKNNGWYDLVRIL